MLFILKDEIVVIGTLAPALLDMYGELTYSLD